MQASTLRPFWIVPPDRNGPLGFGVTGFSLEDALQILQEFGYPLPEDSSTLHVREHVPVCELDHHVVCNMGPIVVRGLWYPFFQVGV